MKTDENLKSPVSGILSSRFSSVWFCYRGGYIQKAVPLRLDNQFIFHSVLVTNWLQKYN